jgi:hypothetical protein
LLIATGAVIRSWLNFIRDGMRRAGQTIREASLIAWLH